MRVETLERLLEDVAAGRVAADAALERMRWLPVEEVAGADEGAPFARLDHHRALRQGHPEVVFCPGKSPEQLVAICRSLHERGAGFLATRADADQRQRLSDAFPDARINEHGRVVHVTGAEKPARPPAATLVISAGTGDVPVAEEAASTAEALGHDVNRLYDVGVAGIHRVLREGDLLRSAGVVIVVAGMEGALPSVVGGLVAAPTIAVPTSVGYGAAFGGVAALLGMLNSCAAGVVVVNIDNGFGAAYAADRIQRAGMRAHARSAHEE